jgi:hypothetical protein
MVTEAYFKRRQQQIVNELYRAKYCIWIAKAWFCEKEIYDILIQRAKEGLNVEIILMGDEKEMQDNGLNVKEFMEAGGEIYYLNNEDSNYVKYSEFCIIDLKTVIYGAYKNKTSNHNRNIAVFKNFGIVTNQFKNEYMEMKNEYSKSVY